MITKCIELNWLCKHNGKGQKQPSSHSRNELSKTQFFPVSVLKGNASFVQKVIYQLLMNLKQKSLKLKTYHTLHYNMTRVLQINSSNRMFFSIHSFTFFMTDTKLKEQVSFESWEKKKLLAVQFSVKFVMLSVWSIVLANWFAYLPDCTIAITRVALTSL